MLHTIIVTVWCLIAKSRSSNQYLNALALVTYSIYYSIYATLIMSLERLTNWFSCSVYPLFWWTRYSATNWSISTINICRSVQFTWLFCSIRVSIASNTVFPSYQKLPSYAPYGLLRPAISDKQPVTSILFSFSWTCSGLSRSLMVTFKPPSVNCGFSIWHNACRWIARLIAKVPQSTAYFLNFSWSQCQVSEYATPSPKSF